MAQLVKNPCAMPRETWVQSLDWEDPLERERLPISVFWPGESHGLYSLWGHKETERLSLSLSITKSCLTLWNPMDCSTQQVLLSMGFSRQEYWSGLPFSSPGDLPGLGNEPTSSSLEGNSLPPRHWGSSQSQLLRNNSYCLEAIWSIVFCSSSLKWPR